MSTATTPRPTPLSVSRPTAPLPQPAVEALARLELKVAAVRYRDASELCSSLSMRGDVEGCLRTQDEMRMCLCQLEQAGRLDLIGGGR